MNDDKLYVWVRRGESNVPILCGELSLLNGRRCIFSYDEAWLNHQDGFALSPDMPLKAGKIEPQAGLDLHPIFADAGPDRWGKNVIDKVFNPDRKTPLAYLELAGEDRIGALQFSRSNKEYIPKLENAFYAADIPNLIRAANALDMHMPIDAELKRLLRPGSTAGGARPKAIIEYNHEPWIAKFPAHGDLCDVCAIEHATLKLAQLCGIDVPDSQLLKIGKQNVMLVKRFDRDHDRRIHFASARTLLFADGVAEGAMAYSDMAAVARRYSPYPKDNNHQLFRRMVFNVLIENTDDHDKNHAFLMKEGQWCLSPAYDMSPQLLNLNYHQLQLGQMGSDPSIINLLSDSKRFMLNQQEAENIIDAVLVGVGQWKEVFDKAGVLEHEIDLCEKYILAPKLFMYGVVPSDVPIASGVGPFSGKIKAIDDHFVYQSLGRRGLVKHDRAVLPRSPLPDQTVDIQYADEHVSLTRSNRADIQLVSTGK